MVRKCPTFAHPAGLTCGAFAHPAGLTCGAFGQLFGTGGRAFDHQK